MFSPGKQAEGYYTLPAGDHQRNVVQNFVVGRGGFGCVRFLGETNLSELPVPLDRYVKFEQVEPFGASIYYYLSVLFTPVYCRSEKS